MMNNELSKRTPEEQHRRQTWLEIWLPLVFGLLICIVLIVFVIIAASQGNSAIAQWSAISLILMIVPTLFVCLLFIALIIFLDVLVIKGNHTLPAYGKLARDKVDKIATSIQKVALSFVMFFNKVNMVIQFFKDVFSSILHPKNK
ncbi:MAG: hypothetical protein AB9897_06525 [Anaerolineaceae bacterium]